MKNKSPFIKIYIILLIISIITLIVLSILGNKIRVGYLGEFKFDEYHIENTLKLNGFDIDETKKVFTIDNILNNDALTNYIFTNEAITNYSYGFRVKYYDKVFRNSDIYGVYIDTNKLINDNNFIKSIKTDGNGSPFGNLISSKVIDETEKIDNINYILKVKKIFHINIFIFLLLYLFLIKKDRIKSFIKNLKIYNKNIEFNVSSFMILGYLYLIIPYMIFLFGWTKYYISIPLIILLIITLYLMIKKTLLTYNKVYSINLLVLISIILIIILFIIVLGIGELFPQSGDMRNGRNAVMRDLINFSWPIVYPENGFGFVYYFAHWVVPSIIGKISNIQIALLVLVLWSFIGIFIFFILIINILNIKNNKYILISLVIFIFFGSIPYSAGGIFIEYASITTQIYNLFNQSIAIWVMCSLFLYQKNSLNFAFLGLSVGFYSPYAVIGILPYMIVKVILDIKENRLKELKSIFSIENILSSISIFPILFLYLTSSDTVSDSFEILISKHNYIKLLINYMMAFGLLIILLYKSNKNNYIFYTSIFVFIFVSMIKYSQDHNFSRTNFTAIFFLIIFIIKYFNDNIGIISIRKYMIIFVLILGSYNSILYIENQMATFLEIDIIDDRNIGRKTFNKNIKYDWVLRTITCQNINKSIFFKYIAKDNNK